MIIYFNYIIFSPPSCKQKSKFKIYLSFSWSLSLWQLILFLLPFLYIQVVVSFLKYKKILKQTQKNKGLVKKKEKKLTHLFFLPCPFLLLCVFEFFSVQLLLAFFFLLRSSWLSTLTFLSTGLATLEPLSLMTVAAAAVWDWKEFDGCCRAFRRHHALK